MKNTIAILASFIVSYLFFSFVKTEFNAFNWSEHLRAFYLFFSCIVCIAALVFVIIDEE